MNTTANPDEYWPKAACDYCNIIRYAPVDLICETCGRDMVLMRPREIVEGSPS